MTVRRPHATFIVVGVTMGMLMACGTVGSPNPPENVGVAPTIERQKRLEALEELRTFSERIEKGLFARLTVTAAIDQKSQIGGTARTRVEQRIKELERMFS